MDKTPTHTGARAAHLGEDAAARQTEANRTSLRAAATQAFWAAGAAEAMVATQAAAVERSTRLKDTAVRGQGPDRRRCGDRPR